MKFLFRPTTYREVYFLGMASAGLCVGFVQYVLGKDLFRQLDDMFWTSPAIALPTIFIGLAYCLIRLYFVPQDKD
jgi:hypothetical protein